MEFSQNNNPQIPAEIGDGVELYSHLRFAPWVMLPLKFEPEPSLHEVKRLKQEGHHCIGQIDLQNKCPILYRSLESFLSVSASTSINLIWLEPGQKKFFSFEEKDALHPLTVNIALHMPIGANFSVDLQADGSEGLFKKIIPLVTGDIFLFNHANHYHCENNSAKTMILLSVQASPLLPEAKIIESARLQNNAPTHREIVNKLAMKKSFLGIEAKKDQALYLDLTNHGMSPDILPEFVSIGVFTEWLDEPLLQEEALQITKASLLIVEHDVVPLELAGSWAAKKKNQGKKFAIMMAAGTYIPNMELFILESIRLIGEMSRNKKPLMGHLLNKKNRLPYLHEQFILVNLDSFRAEELEFGLPQITSQSSFPAFHTSVEQIHDDYTPFWIKSDKASSGDGDLINGLAGFGTKLIATILGRDVIVENIPLSLRDKKSFIYPRDGRGENYHRTREAIEQYWIKNREKFFVFNTEKLRLQQFSIKPAVYLFPCAGMKPFAIFSQFENEEPNPAFYFLEKNRESLKFYEKLLGCTDFDRVLALLKSELISQESLPSADLIYVKNTMQSILQEGFDGKQELFMRSLRKISQSAKLIQLDYLIDHDKIASFINGENKALFWHSNAWESNQASFRSTSAQLRRNYYNLVGRLSKQTEKKAWVHKNGYDAIIGDDFHSPQIILTAGGLKKNPPKLSAFDPYIQPLSSL